MTTRMRIIFVEIIIFYLLGIMSQSALAWEEYSFPRVKSLWNLASNLGNENPSVKRANIYAYISEYKRLPMYNFGLGKRYAGNSNNGLRQFSFGIGKRMRDNRYKFEGKRNEEIIPWDIDTNDYLDFMKESKRDYPYYSFGIGKRDFAAESIASEIGLTDVDGPKYMLDLGKGIAKQDLAELEDMA